MSLSDVVLKLKEQELTLRLIDENRSEESKLLKVSNNELTFDFKKCKMIVCHDITKV
jgi:hypothetical protein